MQLILYSILVFLCTLSKRGHLDSVFLKHEILPWELLSVFLQTDPSCTISTGLQILYIKSASTQAEPPTREEGEMRHGLLGSGTAHQMNLEEKEV